MPDSRPVELRLNGTNLMANGGGIRSDLTLRTNNTIMISSNGRSRSILMEIPIEEFAINLCAFRRLTPLRIYMAWSIWNVAVYTNAYFKQNNFVENDYSDLLKLIAVLNLNKEPRARPMLMMFKK